MKENIRAIFRGWCRDQKLIINIEEENLLINEIFGLFREELNNRSDKE